MIRSGQTTVTTAGTAVVLGSIDAGGHDVLVKALNANTGFMYIGNDGADDVSSSTGLELDSSEEIIFSSVDHLGDIWVDASVNGEKVAWVILG